MRLTREEAQAEVVRRELEGVPPPSSCACCYFYGQELASAYCSFSRQAPVTCPVWDTWVEERDYS